jgi:aspartate--ammonia ligase
MSEENTEKTYRNDYGLRMIYINYIKRQFSMDLSNKLDLTWVPAPLYVTKASGLNDELDGGCRKITFFKDGAEMEIVQSLAKWKRFALKSFNLPGLYTDMNAIRLNETLDETHALHVDQWDWEMIIDDDNYTGKPLSDASAESDIIDYNKSMILLKRVVNKIFKSIRNVDGHLSELIVGRNPLLKDIKDITFITSEELRAKYPTLTPRERECAIAKEKGIVFISQIGKKLSDDTVHGSRAMDYDNWEFNGDMIVWNPCMNNALELSSMGIRVDADSLRYQYESMGIKDIPNTSYHDMILNNDLPKTVGGGIGQSRLFMWLLQLPDIAMVHPDSLLMRRNPSSPRT